MKQQNIAIIGGGAAGFFAAINYAELNPNAQVTIYEQSTKLLSKVKISGGGRCNVTHACWIPEDLVEYYPRGKKELLSAFYRFCTGDTVAWFENKNILLKIEEDGRMFPQTDSSQTIIDCFLNETKRLKIKINKQHKLIDLQKLINVEWELNFQNGYNCQVDKVLIACGSSNSIWKLLKKLGHAIIEPVPSLFTFNSKDDLLKNLAGISLPQVEVKISNSKFKMVDNFLITHWGISGFSVLKLSAFAARYLAEKNYTFEVQLNFTPNYDIEQVTDALVRNKSKTKVINDVRFSLPKRLWRRLVELANIESGKNWFDLSNKELSKLIENLTAYSLTINGKSTFKQEFVTAGGVDLKEVDMKRFESKLLPNLFFAGEVLNIDAITGGFNFQAAWTGAFIAANAMAEMK